MHQQKLYAAFWSATVPDFPSNFDIQDFSLDKDIEFGRVRTNSNTTLDSTLPYESTSIKEKKKIVSLSFGANFMKSAPKDHNLKVPVLRHDFQLDEWTAVARIIRKRYEISGYWPISILPYLSPAEIHIVKNAISDFQSTYQEDLLEFLDSHFCRKSLAQLELIQQPRYIIDCFRGRASTFRKIKRECVSYLTRYIKKLDGEKLKAFLRFCTGFDVLLNMKTTVEFIDVDGYTISPIAHDHTCGKILKIPSTYELLRIILQSEKCIRPFKRYTKQIQTPFSKEIVYINIHQIQECPMPTVS
ncbi:hypothetical protein KUTeg_021278 [Tegillarca granosa]|uniref:Uncharacterized protein n=1 Tax=Tegillarca granosa TaxID=220873 RepID=A0ABQ9EEL4_TEGGR|nr:hypothetical protein KUTeg_021278 [Tegillarca granosa]